MVLAQLVDLFKRFSGQDRPFARAKKAHNVRPHLTTLEDRMVPAQIIWTGNGTNDFWSNPKNWNLNRAPQMDDQVILASDPAVFDATSDINKRTCTIDRVNNIGLPLRTYNGSPEYNVVIKNLLVGGPNQDFKLIVSNTTLTVLSNNIPAPADPNSGVGVVDFGYQFLRNNATNYNAGLVEIGNGSIELRDKAYIRTPVLLQSPNWAWLGYPNTTTEGKLLFTSTTTTTSNPTYPSWSNLIAGYVSLGNTVTTNPVDPAITVNEGYHQIVQADRAAAWMTGNSYPSSWPKWDTTNNTNVQYVGYGEIAMGTDERFEISPATGTLEINQFIVSGKNVYTNGFTNNYTKLVVTGIANTAPGNFNVGNGLGYRPGDGYQTGRDFRLGSLVVDTGINLKTTSTNNHVVYTRDTQVYNGAVNFLGNVLFYFRSFANITGITGDITFAERITAQATGTGAKIKANLQVGTFSSCVLSNNGVITVSSCNPASLGTFRFNTLAANNIGQLAFENGTYEHNFANASPLVVDQLFTLNSKNFANNTKLTTVGNIGTTPRTLIQISGSQANTNKLFYRVVGAGAAATKVKLTQGSTFPVAGVNFKISYTGKTTGTITSPTGGNSVVLY